VRPTTGPTTLDLAAKSDGAAVCKGDTGGPLLSTTGGHTAIAGVNGSSWQGGCLGTDPAETRTGAVAARADDLAGWVQQVAYSTAFAAAPWKHAVQMTAGYYTGDSAGGTRHMDLIVVWDDGEVTLYQGGDGNDPAHPFAAEHRLQPEKSIWTKAVSVTGVNTGGGTDGLVVRWIDGETTIYPGLTDKALPGEIKIRPAKSNWADATVVTAGSFTGNTTTDDVLVRWNDGHIRLFPAVDYKGLHNEIQLAPANWPTRPRRSDPQPTGLSCRCARRPYEDGRPAPPTGRCTAPANALTSRRGSRPACPAAGRRGFTAPSATAHGRSATDASMPPTPRPAPDVRPSEPAAGAGRTGRGRADHQCGRPERGGGRPDRVERYGGRHPRVPAGRPVRGACP
jgi:hypothetical protein